MEAAFFLCLFLSPVLGHSIGLAMAPIFPGSAVKWLASRCPVHRVIFRVH